MSDWKNNQYDHGPKSDPLAGEGDLKWPLAVIGLVVAGVASVALLIFGLAALL